MAYAIDFEPDALKELKAHRKADQVKVLEAIQLHLTHEPSRQSKSRIKHMRPGTQPTYRLRVDEFRVYYDVLAQPMLVIIYGGCRQRTFSNLAQHFCKKSSARRSDCHEDDFCR